MKPIEINKDNSFKEKLYEQLYENIKGQIMSNDMESGEKCPSLRSLANELDISVTTVMMAYNQLLAEGYIKNKPGSGYYVERVVSSQRGEISSESNIFGVSDTDNNNFEYVYDEEAFDFNRWKKCSSKIFTEYSSSLLFGSELKGELELRTQIARYLFHSRGVSVSSENIIIAAGTQQSIFHIGRVLKSIGINLISMEHPGYSPVRSMFKDAGFSVLDVEVTDAGINIDELPQNISSAVYVNPSNQFPTGVVMPAGKRHDILKWAEDNGSFVIEDDYNSELRYFGKPLPTIKSLDSMDKVIYLGSFSSTLFSAIKISYMVLPKTLADIFDETRKNYSQTCSKAEQLTLAYYMSEGYYYTAIKKKRALYSKKLKIVTEAFEKYNFENIKLINTNSGLFVTIKISSDALTEKYIEEAKKLRVFASLIEEISTESEKYISLYYSYIPLGSMELILNILLNKWRSI